MIFGKFFGGWCRVTFYRFVSVLPNIAFYFEFPNNMTLLLNNRVLSHASVFISVYRTSMFASMLTRHFYIISHIWLTSTYTEHIFKPLVISVAIWIHGYDFRLFINHRIM